MRPVALALSLVVLMTSCGGDSKAVARTPASVRGWVEDVEGSGAGQLKTMETEIARRTSLFSSTRIWVENAPYVSGGIAQNGAFILLDVPPGAASIGFNAPGAESTHLTLQNIPGNADVMIPRILLRKGGATVLDPKQILVRVPGSGTTRKPTGQTAIVGGFTVPVIQVPLSELVDRRDYPNPPGVTPLATVK
jgi:hypothetical protein